MRDKIAVIGSLNYDIIMKIPRFPVCGENISANEVHFSGGGKGANQAVQSAKLGVETYMVGCVGTDAQGDFIIENMEKYGLKTKYIRRVSEPTGMGVVNAIEDGSVFATIVRGANYAVTKQDIDTATEIFDETRLIMLQMEIPQEINMYAIDKAKEHGCKVMLNAAPAAEIPEEYLKKCDILVVNEVEAGFYLGENVDSVEKAKEGAEKLYQSYGCDVIITLGKAGAVIIEKGEVAFIPSKKVNAVETTGAGDSFIGGIGYALLNEKTLIEAGKFATCCSAVTVCRVGAQPSMPRLEEVIF